MHGESGESTEAGMEQIDRDTDRRTIAFNNLPVVLLTTQLHNIVFNTRFVSLMSIVAKRLDGSRCHLVWRQASTQATLCQTGTQLLSPKRGHSPQFSAHVYSQTAGWIKMSHGMEIGQSTLCQMGTQLPSPKRGAQPPIFGLCLL